MKKQLLLAVSGLCFTLMVVAQTSSITIVNGSFEDPNDGMKHFYINDTTTDGWVSEDVRNDNSGREIKASAVDDGVGYHCYFNDSALEVYQLTGETIPAGAVDYSATAKWRVDWVTVGDDTLTGYFTFSCIASGGDPTARIPIDSAKFPLPVVGNGGSQPDTIISGTIHIPAASSFAGKKLIIGFMARNINPLHARNDWFLIDSVTASKTVILGIPTVNSELSLRISPNPSNGLITLKSKLGSKIEVFDVTGKSILSRISNGNDLIDLSKNGKGVYLIRATTTSGSLTVQKIIIK